MSLKRKEKEGAPRTEPGSFHFLFLTRLADQGNAGNQRQDPGYASWVGEGSVFPVRLSPDGVISSGTAVPNAVLFKGFAHNLYVDRVITDDINVDRKRVQTTVASIYMPGTFHLATYFLLLI